MNVSAVNIVGRIATIVLAIGLVASACGSTPDPELAAGEVASRAQVPGQGQLEGPGVDGDGGRGTAVDATTIDSPSTAELDRQGFLRWWQQIRVWFWGWIGQLNQQTPTVAVPGPTDGPDSDAMGSPDDDSPGPQTDTGGPTDTGDPATATAPTTPPADDGETPTTSTTAGGPATTPGTSGQTTTERTTTSQPSSTSSSRPSGGGTYFETLAPGADLPSGHECASRVKSKPEVRARNANANNTRGTKPNGRYPRVDGNFVGTTDEIIQWAACKWGIDEDWARAQAAKESWWDMAVGGDQNGDQSACHPELRTGSGTCPESIGLMQVRYLYHLEAFEDSNSIRSSAYNVDYAFAVWRACYNGELDWLNTVERGAEYRAGDLEGCLGVWFTGRWYVADAYPYIEAVRDYRNSRVWESSGFLGYG